MENQVLTLLYLQMNIVDSYSEWRNTESMIHSSDKNSVDLFFLNNKIIIEELRESFLWEKISA